MIVLLLKDVLEFGSAIRMDKYRITLLTISLSIVPYAHADAILRKVPSSLFVIQYPTRGPVARQATISEHVGMPRWLQSLCRLQGYLSTSAFAVSSDISRRNNMESLLMPGFSVRCEHSRPVAAPSQQCGYDDLPNGEKKKTRV